MTTKPKPPGSGKAGDDLEAVARMKKAGERRGSIPLWFAALAAAWVGLMTTMVLEDYEHTLWFLLIGAFLILTYRQKKGAWIQEFQEKKIADIFFRALGGAAIVGGGIFLAKAYPVAWAAKAIGAAFGLYIFALLTWAHGKAWKNTIKRRD